MDGTTSSEHDVWPLVHSSGMHLPNFEGVDLHVPPTLRPSSATQPLLNTILGHCGSEACAKISCRNWFCHCNACSKRAVSSAFLVSRTSMRFRNLSMQLSVKANCCERSFVCGFLSFLKCRLQNIDFWTERPTKNIQIATMRRHSWLLQGLAHV